MGLALSLVAFVAGSPFAGGPVPSTVVDSFRVEVRAPSGAESIAGQAPESLAARLHEFALAQARGGKRQLVAATLRGRAVYRAAFP